MIEADRLIDTKASREDELIDRASAEAKQMLIDVARGEIVLAAGSSRPAGGNGAGRWRPLQLRLRCRR